MQLAARIDSVLKCMRGAKKTPPTSKCSSDGALCPVPADSAVRCQPARVHYA